MPRARLFAAIVLGLPLQTWDSMRPFILRVVYQFILISGFSFKRFFVPLGPAFVHSSVQLLIVARSFVHAFVHAFLQGFLRAVVAAFSPFVPIVYSWGHRCVPFFHLFVRPFVHSVSSSPGRSPALVGSGSG